MSIPIGKYIFPLLENFPHDLHVSAEIQDCRMPILIRVTWKGYPIHLRILQILPEAPADKILLETTSLENGGNSSRFLTPDLYIQLSENAVLMVMNKRACKMNGVKTLARPLSSAREEIAQPLGMIIMISGCCGNVEGYCRLKMPSQR